MHWVTLCAALTTSFDALISSLDRQAIFERLLRRNSIRRQIGNRLIDVPRAYQRKINQLNEQRCTDLLEPYLAITFGQVDWPSKFTPRLLLAVKLHKQAVAQVHRDHGIADPRTKTPTY